MLLRARNTSNKVRTTKLQCKKRERRLRKCKNELSNYKTKKKFLKGLSTLRKLYRRWWRSSAGQSGDTKKKTRKKEKNTIISRRIGRRRARLGGCNVPDAEKKQAKWKVYDVAQIRQERRLLMFEMVWGKKNIKQPQWHWNSRYIFWWNPFIEREAWKMRHLGRVELKPTISQSINEFESIVYPADVARSKTSPACGFFLIYFLCIYGIVLVIKA